MLLVTLGDTSNSTCNQDFITSNLYASYTLYVQVGIL